MLFYLFIYFTVCALIIDKIFLFVDVCVFTCVQQVPCVLHNEISLKCLRFALFVLSFTFVLACVGQLWKCDR